MVLFVIEHMEKELYTWCLIEYKRISSIVGSDHVLFTHVDTTDYENLKGLGSVSEKSCVELAMEKVCILDSRAERELAPSDRDMFSHVVFGGILGDDPPQHRTEELLTKFREKGVSFEMRSLGNKQMSTDTAVYVTKGILDGRAFSDFTFEDGIDIETGEGESVYLPYRYVVEHGKPLISSALVEYLKKKEDI